jgi:YVTN family beta-propeller protein
MERWIRGLAHQRSALIAIAAVIAVVGAGAMVAETASAPGTTARPVPLLTAGPSACPVGSFPEVPAYDPVNHYLYVPDENSGNITVLKPNCHAVASIGLPIMAGPSAIVYDPADNMLYVTDSYLGSVYVISGLSLKHTFPESKLHCPQAPFYDPAIGDVLVGSDCGSPQLTELNGTAIVGHVGHAKIWSDPATGVYDPSSHRILVAYTNGANVTFYNASTFKISGKVSVGMNSDPVSIVYDPSNHLDYVACFSVDTVTVISSHGAGSTKATIPVGGGPANVAYSPTSLEVYVANSGSANVSVIKGTTLKATISLAAFARPEGLVYDAVTLKMYVTDADHSVIEPL